MMHRRAGGEAAGLWRTPKHADAHKYCQIGRCGTRPGPYTGGRSADHAGSRSEKITSWRIAKARANRAYLEENVYGKKAAGLV